MKKLIFFLIQLTVVVSLFLWFYVNPGFVDIHWLGYQAHMSIGMFSGLLLCGGGLIWFVLKLLMWVCRIPQQLSVKYRLYRLHQAQQSLKDTLTKYNNKDFKSIHKSLKIVLEEEETQFIGHYFAVEIAKAENDALTQEHHLHEIIKMPGTQTLGYTKLIQLKMVQHEPIELLRCAKLAAPFAQEAPELAKLIFYVYLDHRLISEAEDVLKQIKRMKAISAQSQSILDSDLASINTQIAIESKNISLALIMAEKAYRLYPVYDKLKVYIELLLSQESFKQVQKILERVWAEHPHLQLVSFYQETQKKALPSLKFQGIEKLTQGNPSHAESLLAKAHAALEAQLWGLALDYLQDYERKYPLTRRFLRLRAKYAQEACHDQEAALSWLAKEETALSIPDEATMVSMSSFKGL